MALMEFLLFARDMRTRNKQYSDINIPSFGSTVLMSIRDGRHIMDMNSLIIWLLANIVPINILRHRVNK